ncbi:hypothetical protein HC891_25140 [Candidatus Gracilibacteria bacterium]|nr:hypothetical protein [Candidatus Gracilibacteria bacterium]
MQDIALPHRAGEGCAGQVPALLLEGPNATMSWIDLGKRTIDRAHLVDELPTR